MHTLVCIKSVVLQAGAGAQPRTGDNCGFNPFDAAALELALQLKERHGGSVTTLSMGPATSRFVLLEAMAAGADRGVLVTDAALKGSDTLVTARVLTAAIERLKPCDLVLFGTRTADSDTGQVGPQVATLLDLPLVTWVRSVECRPETILVERSADGYRELFETPVPAALTVHSAAGALRDTGLGSIQSVLSEDPVETWSIDRLGLTAAQVGEEGSPTRVVASVRASKKKNCHFLEGAADGQADALIDRLVAAGLLG